MSTYEELSIARKKEQDKGNLPNWFTTSAYQLIKKNYLWKDSTLKETYQRMADTAIKHLEGKLPVEEVKYIHKRFFEILWNGDLAAASPVFNLGTPRGMPVSCSGGMVKDSVSGFYEHRLESALLCKLQFGTSGYLGRIRPRGAPIGPGGTAAGAAMVFKGLFQDTQDITQGTLRRGSYGAYIDQNGGDFEEIMDIMFADPEGKNLGVNYYDKDVKSVLTNDENNVTFNRWRKHMKLRALYGKGYFYFVDRVARLQPPMYDPKHFKLTYNIDDVIGTYVDYMEDQYTVRSVIDMLETGEHVRLLTDSKTILDIESYENVEGIVTFNVVRELRSKASNLCLVGDTKIRIKYNGLEHDIELSDFIYAWNQGLYTSGVTVKSENGEFKEITAAAKMGEVNKLYRITTDSGKIIECTGDHKIKTSNRGYVKAKDLIETDELIEI